MNKTKLHILKIKEKWFIDIMNDKKKAELRINDRDYHVDDLIHFTDIDGNEYYGVFNLFKITHVLPLDEVDAFAKNYVILSITPYETHKPLWEMMK